MTSGNSSEIIKFDSFLEIWQLLEKLIDVEKSKIIFSVFN